MDLVVVVERTLLFVALSAALFVPLERIWPRVRRAFDLRTLAVDVGWLLLGALTLTLIVGPLLRLVRDGIVNDDWRLALAFVGAELLSYACHRAMHAVPWLWRIHAVHHGPRQLSWSNAWRQHPIDVALHALVVAIPGLVLGVSLSSLAGFVLLRRLWTVFLHANVRARLGILEDLVAMPAFHHAHHSHDPRLFNANFAGLFPWIDRIFGTYRRPRALDPTAVRPSPPCRAVPQRRSAHQSSRERAGLLRRRRIRARAIRARAARQLGAQGGARRRRRVRRRADEGSALTDRSALAMPGP